MKNNRHEFLSVEQAAEIVNVSARTLYRWYNEGRVEFVKLGSRTCVARGEINRLARELQTPVPLGSSRKHL